MNITRTSLDNVLSTQGLRLRGGWVPGPDDALPVLPGDRPAVVVWMVGQVGSQLWPVFAASRFARDGLADPMDRWSKSIGDELARTLEGAAVYPSDGPPWAPFQQWAARAEPLQTSRLMLQIHPEFGLWHAARFALVLPALAPEDAAALAAPHAAVADLCAQCDGQPCLHACPADAFTGTGYRVDDCAAHLHSPRGGACMEGGCLARRACPVGAAHRYVPEHAVFHMAAFAGRHPVARLAACDPPTEAPQ